MSSRILFHQRTSFNIENLLYNYCQEIREKLKEVEGYRIGKLKRKKIKVPREYSFEHSVGIFQIFLAKRSILEFEFSDEEGSGLGPTLEFYSIVADQIKKPELNLWRKTHDNSLFPSAFIREDLFERTRIIFRMIGCFLGRIIIDHRTIDFPINPILWKLCKRTPFSLQDLEVVEPEISKTLLVLQKIANKYCGGVRDKESLMFSGVSIEELDLCFTLPGYDTIELLEKGKDVQVNLENLQEYIDKVVRFYLWDSIKIQVCDFCEGIQNLVPYSTFCLFNEEELVTLFSGTQQDMKWNLEILKEAIGATHGYSDTSMAYNYFLEILNEMEISERIAFVKFVTGTSRLPYGGLRSLNPKMTIVKSMAEEEQNSDSLLPSVMTCQNYIKLPDYSSKERMREKLSYAIKEGQNNFSLS